jgi:hypothetical protein
VCWGDEQGNPVLALTQALSGPLATRAVDRGAAAYVQVACSTNDVYRRALQLQTCSTALGMHAACNCLA